MAKIELKGIRKSFDADRNSQGHRSHDRGRRVHLAGRSVRLRQVDAAAHHRRPRAAKRRRGVASTAVGRRRPAQRAQSGDGVPVLCAVSASDRVRQHRGAAAHAPPFRAGTRCPCSARCCRAGASTERGIRADVERVAAQLEITPLLKRKPGQLSGGQRQRVAVGRAIVRQPRRRSCSMNPCPISTPSCACTCAPSSPSCIAS